MEFLCTEKKSTFPSLCYPYHLQIDIIPKKFRNDEIQVTIEKLTMINISDKSKSASERKRKKSIMLHMCVNYGTKKKLLFPTFPPKLIVSFF